MNSIADMGLLSCVKRVILFTGVLLTLLSCSDSNRKQAEQSFEKSTQHDSIVICKIITNEIAGSAYRVKANGYSIVLNSDTSDFMVVFSEGNRDGRVGIRAHYDSFFLKGKLYKDRFTELEMILEVAEEDFNFDSLRTVSIGRLISTGDLAVDISKEYKNKYGDNYQITSYDDISDFLLNSRLGNDFNRLFMPYSIQVKRIEVEKVFFTSKESLLSSSIVEADTADIPAKILDCLTWIVLERTDGV